MDLPIENGGSGHSYVSLPEGTGQKKCAEPLVHHDMRKNWNPKLEASL